MTKLRDWYERFDRAFTDWLARYGITLLRLSLGVIFLWFGLLKFFPGASSAEGIATHTISALSRGLIRPVTALYILAVWETLIGVGLILGRYMRVVLLLLWVQMLGTITPIFILPVEVFEVAPFIPTLEGQYIFKNLVLISAGLVIGATVRGGKLVADPKVLSYD